MGTIAMRGLGTGLWTNYATVGIRFGYARTAGLSLDVYRWSTAGRLGLFII